MALDSMRLSILIGLAIKFGTIAMFPETAHSAVRVCKEIVISGTHEADGEIAAKKLALEDWKAQSAKFGENHLSFRIAAHAMLRCAGVPNGKFLCRACGAPCIVRQVPPAGWKTYRRAWKNRCLPYMDALGTIGASRELLTPETELPAN